jgi:hypothetical protein
MIRYTSYRSLAATELKICNMKVGITEAEDSTKKYYQVQGETPKN